MRHFVAHAAHLLRAIPRKRGPPSKLLRSSLRVC